MAPYSMDLRERVIRDGDAGLKAEAIAEKYAVGSTPYERGFDKAGN